MPKRILQVIESAYRGTLEEQDDTVLWITHALQGAGGHFGVLLRGNAVNYAVRGQDASGLAFGGKRQTQPPRLEEDVAKLLVKGVEVAYVEEDAAERGIAPADLIEGVRPVRARELPQLLEAFDQVWHW
jgi:sulfur relay (sulfurtransferase) DsrF/TusC family protein